MRSLAHARSLPARMAPSADAAGNGGGAGPGAARDELLVYVNGVRRTLPPGRAEVTLLQYLRGAWHARAPMRALRARRRSRRGG